MAALTAARVSAGGIRSTDPSDQWVAVLETLVSPIAASPGALDEINIISKLSTFASGHAKDHYYDRHTASGTEKSANVVDSTFGNSLKAAKTFNLYLSRSEGVIVFEQDNWHCCLIVREQLRPSDFRHTIYTSITSVQDASVSESPAKGLNYHRHTLNSLKTRERHMFRDKHCEVQQRQPQNQSANDLDCVAFSINRLCDLIEEIIANPTTAGRRDAGPLAQYHCFTPT